MFRSLTQFYMLTLFGEIQDTFASLHSDENLSLRLATEDQPSRRFAILLCRFNNALLNLPIMAKHDTRMQAFFCCRRHRVTCWKHVTMHRSSYSDPSVIQWRWWIAQENKRRSSQKTHKCHFSITRYNCHFSILLHYFLVILVSRHGFSSFEYRS